MGATKRGAGLDDGCDSSICSRCVTRWLLIWGQGQGVGFHFCVDKWAGQGGGVSLSLLAVLC